MGADALDDHRVFNPDTKFYGSTAVRTGLDVDPEERLIQSLAAGASDRANSLAICASQLPVRNCVGVILVHDLNVREKLLLLVKPSR